VQRDTAQLMSEPNLPFAAFSNSSSNSNNARVKCVSSTRSRCTSLRKEAFELALPVAVSGVLLVALVVAHFPVFVASNDMPELGGGTAASNCFELSARRDRLQAQIERLHAETASVEAELAAVCKRADQMSVGLRPSDPPLPAATVSDDRSIGDPRHKQSKGASTSARTLLQDVSPAEPACSMDELMAVQADPAAAVVGLFTTNPSCAMCLVPCGSAADAVSCAMGCLKQARVPTQLFRRLQAALWHFSHLFPKAKFQSKINKYCKCEYGVLHA
jgi:hypothetical protein